MQRHGKLGIMVARYIPSSGHTDGLTVWWKTSSKTFVGGEHLGPEGVKSKLFHDDIVASIPPC
jgi:hypothetical protein